MDGTTGQHQTNTSGGLSAEALHRKAVTASERLHSARKRMEREKSVSAALDFCAALDDARAAWAAMPKPVVMWDAGDTPGWFALGS